MGFSDSEINSITSDKPKFADKLLAVINAMLQKFGHDYSESVLLRACQEIQPSVYGVVCDDVENLARPVQDYTRDAVH
jgi:hypothetical protein